MLNVFIKTENDAPKSLLNQFFKYFVVKKKILISKKDLVSCNLNVVKALFHVYEGSISSPLIF